MEARAATADDRRLVEALRAGDEAAFSQLIDAYHGPLVRLAMSFVPSRAVAEEVVQETWLGVLKGIDGFEGRSSLKTWIYRILTNTAKTRGRRESRSVPFSSLEGPEDEGPLLGPDRFLPADHERWPTHWAVGPTPWEVPEESLLSGEAREVILAAIGGLPPNQRLVVTMRDVEGCSSEEVCNTLEISETNQRVLLHRGRNKVRTAIEAYLGATEPTL